MVDSRLVKMAETIAEYSLSLKPGEQVLVLASVPALPLVALYLVLSEQFIKGLTAGAVKG